MRAEDHIKRLYKLNRGDKHVYHNSGQRGRYSVVFAKAYELYEAGRLQLSQKRREDKTIDYIATGLMSDLDKEKAGMS